jgi:hypothetical protein
MEYLILIYETEATFAARPTAGPEYHGAWMEYTKALQQAGVMKGGNGLQVPATGTTVRMRGGKRQVQDGPYADTKEQLGGYYVIDVPDLDAALEWAAKCPAAPTGAVEVRPVMVH